MASRAGSRRNLDCGRDAETGIVDPNFSGTRLDVSFA
jgi:hypothetical protein